MLLMMKKNPTIRRMLIYSAFVVLSCYSMPASSMPSAIYLVEQKDSLVRKSIYPPVKDKSAVYNWLWGKHYRDLYAMPIVVQSTTLDNLAGGVKVVRQAADFQGLILENKQRQMYLLKPLGGVTSFMESEFFQEVYNEKDFKGTYLNEFIGDAYTIINPYTFMPADYMAARSGLSSNNSRIYFISNHSTSDTIANGSSIQDRLVSVIEIPDVDSHSNVLSTGEFLQKIQEDKLYQADPHQYIRERLFDMLIGDWNKIPENWNWRLRPSGKDSLIYNSIVIDRNHAFTKVDGVLFKQMLKVLGLSFIVNYDSVFKEVKKINKLGFALDMALISGSDESVWLQEARYLQANLTDSLIDDAFTKLPDGIDAAEMGRISTGMKMRRDQLETVARQYFRLLQKTPVIAGTNHSDRFVIDRHHPDSVQLRIFEPGTGQLVFDRKYSKKHTKEIWLYGLEGDDMYEVNGKAGKDFPICLIPGQGKNTYRLNPDKDIQVFDKHPNVYDYEKIRYHDMSFTPWGIYDSDNGISLGAFFTYTMYGFKRAPFTYRHRIGYNYIQGFMYQGIFPSYDGKRSFNLDAQISSPRNFFNFFGFGNNTDGYKDEKKKYNRVYIRQFTFMPSLHFNFSKERNLILYTSLELFKAKRSDDRFINQYYPDNHSVFRSNYFADLGATFQINKNVSSFIPVLGGSLSSGWKMSLKDPGQNFPYTNASVSINMKLTDRLTFAAMVNGQMLFNNKYEFYQSATTELRGYRDNRFIGKQSFYQYSDLRIDMGKLKNPFTPIKYGFFVGFDYGRVWFPGEESKAWHTSYGGGLWLTLINKFTTKYSAFGSTDSFRFMLELGMGF